MYNLIEEFREFSASVGFHLPADIIGDGLIQRFYIEGDSKGSENGWYFLHQGEFPWARVGSWKTNEEYDWRPYQSSNLSPEVKQRLEAEIAQKKREQESQWEIAAKQAKDLYHSCKNLSPSHPYLTKKGIKSSFREREDALGNIVIPIYSDHGARDSIQSLQFIGPDGTKRFLPGGRVSGGYFFLTKRNAFDDEPFLICEGYATGASLLQATELPVYIAFNCGNLMEAAKRVRQMHPTSKIIMCADNDQWTKGNPGLSKACEAAEVFNLGLAKPILKYATEDNRLTDFNDLAQTEGLPRVAEIIEQAIKEYPENRILQACEKIDLEEMRHRGFVDEINDWPKTHQRGRKQIPAACVENTKHLLDKNGIIVRYDVIRKDISIIIPQESYLLDNEKNNKLTRIISLANVAGLPSGSIDDFVIYLANNNPYNPAAEWIVSKPWDGTSRLESFYDTVKATNESDPSIKKLKETLMKRWMVSAVAAAFRPNGVSAHGVLVFRGDQYLGKTNWFKNLVPSELRITKDGVILDPKDKDSVTQCMSNWIVELGELEATFKRSDVAQLKAFIPKEEDTLRLPYGRFNSTFPRKTVFFGSVNPKDYLADQTGNRRFWTIDCEYINHSHGLDMQQVWGEFYELWKKGESWFLNAQEMAALNSYNKDFEPISPIEELIRIKYDWSREIVKFTRKLTATQIAMEIGIKTPQHKDVRAVAKAIKEITKKDSQKSTGGDRFFEMPNLFPTESVGMN